MTSSRLSALCIATVVVLFSACGHTKDDPVEIMNAPCVKGSGMDGVVKVIFTKQNDGTLTVRFAPKAPAGQESKCYVKPGKKVEWESAVEGGATHQPFEIWFTRDTPDENGGIVFSAQQKQPNRPFKVAIKDLKPRKGPQGDDSFDTYTYEIKALGKVVDPSIIIDM